MRASLEILLAFVLFGLVTAGKGIARHIRSRRAAHDLCRMAKLEIGDEFPCYRLLFYGNNCGPFRGNKPPVDPIDQCCDNHDRCWHYYKTMCNVPRLQLYFINYQWDVTPEDGRPYCHRGANMYDSMFCECDLDFVHCLGHLMRSM
ncbi:phospholipase A2 Scol/Pla-like [Argopecten irradians]|uniref:phospholipase A2 Scol/Pla-like n=1 Tax=Argopecten irradians TaxID=31199 RepID=UPI0037159685